MLYPIAAILASLGIWQLVHFIKNKSSKKYLTLTVFLISLIELYLVAPFYLNYTNLLLPKKYTISNSWGFGGYEAAQFINSQPNAENLIVWSDYYGVCPFIKGKCITQYKFNSSLYKIDYFVITHRGKERMTNSNVSWMGTKTNQLNKNNPQWKLEWELDINGRPKNFVKVFKSELKS